MRSRKPIFISAGIIAIAVAMAVAWALSRNGTSAGKLSVEDDIEGEFTKVKVDAGLSDITVRDGDVAHVSYSGPAESSFSYRIDGETLVVSQEMPKDSQQGLEGGNIEISLPQDKSFDSLSVNTQLGDIRMQGLRVASVIAASGAGDIEIENLVSTELSSNTSMGNVTMEDCDTSNATMNLSSGMGTVSIDGKDVASGSYSNGTGETSITLHSDMGDVSVS